MATKRLPNKKIPMISILIATRNRPKSLLTCVATAVKQDYSSFEVVVFDDASDQAIGSLVAETFDDPRVRCLRSDQNVGIAAGRNQLVMNARGSILVFLDDDAILKDEKQIQRIAAHHLKRPDVGIWAFKIALGQESGAGLQIPFSRRILRKNPTLIDTESTVSYFIGAGHAVCKTVFDDCGLYPGYLVFGEEELDLSYRAIDRGFEVRYVPDVVVYHRPERSALGESGKWRRRSELYFTTRNKIWIAYKYLPLRYAFTYAFIWTTFHGILALRDWRVLDFVRGIRSGLLGLRRIKKTTVNPEGILYLKSNFGRLWY